MSIAANLALRDTYDTTIAELELFLEHKVRQCQAAAVYLLRSVPGIGKILAWTLAYEIHDIERFPAAGNFLSYSRLVAGSHESDGKKKRSGKGKMGSVHLKWAFSEAAALFLRYSAKGKTYFQRLERKHGRGKALSVLAAKLGRATYHMLRRRQPFDAQRFLTA